MSALDSVDLTAAARIMVEADEFPDDRYFAAVSDVWEALTSLEGPEAVAYAREIATASPPVTAYLPPC